MRARRALHIVWPRRCFILKLINERFASREAEHGREAGFSGRAAPFSSRRAHGHSAGSGVGESARLGAEGPRLPQLSGNERRRGHVGQRENDIAACGADHRRDHRLDRPPGAGGLCRAATERGGPPGCDHRAGRRQGAHGSGGEPRPARGALHHVERGTGRGRRRRRAFPHRGAGAGGRANWRGRTRALVQPPSRAAPQRPRLTPPSAHSGRRSRRRGQDRRKGRRSRSTASRHAGAERRRAARRAAPWR